MSEREKLFYDIFQKGVILKSALINRIFENPSIVETGLTSAIWKFILTVNQTIDKPYILEDEWLKIIQEKREEYKKLKNEFEKQPENAELHEIIQTDIQRYPGLEEDMQPYSLRNIQVYLYKKGMDQNHYCQEFANISGEIIVIFVREMTTTPDPENPKPFDILYDKNEIESDAFWLLYYILGVMRDVILQIESFVAVIYKSVIEHYNGEAKEQVLELSESINDSFMRSWVRGLFEKAFQSHIEYVHTCIYATFPSTSFLAALCDVCFHEALYTASHDILNDPGKGLVWMLYKYEYPVVLLPRAFKKAFGNHNTIVGGEIAQYLQNLSENIEDKDKENLIQELDNLDSLIHNFTSIKQ